MKPSRKLPTHKAQVRVLTPYVRLDGRKGWTKVLRVRNVPVNPCAR